MEGRPRSLHNGLSNVNPVHININMERHMATDISTTSKSEVSTITESNPNAMLDIIARAASDPTVDVDKMERLLAMQERLMAKQSERNFNVALTSVQEKLPRIKKSGKIEFKGKVQSKYGTYEDIDTVIRPILIEYGFALRFDSPAENGKMMIKGTLSHKDGHSITNSIPLPLDISGSKNNIQGVGSTAAYGKRYIVGMMLNLVFEGDDDDGIKGGTAYLSKEQGDEIKKLLKDSGADEKGFLDYMGVQNVDEISSKDYNMATMALKRKLKETLDAL